MESIPPQAKPARRKVHVVYYLSRGGKVDHPHLIEGYLHSSQDGLRLKDVKRWLAVLRGKGMPNSFAWSYKRNYKNGFIWHDLSENDIILPLCKNEYVIMGSEIRDFLPGKCKCGAAGVDTKRVEDFQNEGMENGFAKSVGTKKGFEVRQGSDHQNGGGGNKSFSLSAQELMEEIRIKPQTRIRSTECDLDAEAGRAPDGFPRAAGPMIKVSPREVHAYKARGSGWASDQSMDAATQTGESKRCSTEDGMLPTQMILKSPAKMINGSSARFSNQGHSQEFSVPVEIQSEAASASPARSTASSTTHKSSRFGREDSSAAPKSKPSSVTTPIVLKQLLSCGSVDINESSIFNLKSLGLHPAAANMIAQQQQQSPRLQKGDHKSWSCRPGRRLSVSDNRSSISVFSDGSIKDGAVESSPDSGFLKTVRVSSMRGGSTSPGVASVCSSSSRRSSGIEVRELHEGGDLEKGFKEAFKNAMKGSPRRAHDHSQHGEQHSTICSPCVPNISSFAMSKHVAANADQETARGSPRPLALERGSVTWRELLWSPKKDAKYASSSHKDSILRRM